MTRARNLFRWVALLAVALVVLAGAAVLLLPHLVDIPAVQRELAQRASRAVQGEVAWEELDVRLFPAPYALLRGARIQIPGTLAASVEHIEVGLRLRPLLHGRVQIDAISVRRPALRVELAPGQRKEPGAAPDPYQAYRAAMRPAMDALQRSMPDATLVLEGARVEVSGSQAPPIGPLAVDLRLRTDAEGIDVDGTVGNEHWKRVQVDVRIEADDLRAKVMIDAQDVKVQRLLEALLPRTALPVVLPAASARLEARSDGRASLESDFRVELPSLALRRGARKLDVDGVRAEGKAKLDGRDLEIAVSALRLGKLVPAAQGTFRLADEPQASVRIPALDLARLRDAALAVAGDEPAVREYLSRLSGGKLTDVRVSAKARSLDSLIRLPQITAALTLEDGGYRLPVLEKPAASIGARLELARSVLQARRVTARVGASRLADGAVDVVLKAPMRLDASGGQAALAIGELYAWLGIQEKLAAVQDVSGSADATLHRLQLRLDRPESLAYDVSLRPKQVRVVLTDLPPATLDGGALRITPDVVTLDRLGAAALDASARVSGTVADVRSGRPRIEARVEDGKADARTVDWVWRRFGLPPRARPATPLRLAAHDLRWSDAGLGLGAEVRFPAGLRAGVDLGLHGEVLDVRRLTLKDGESDAVLRLSKDGNLFDAGFSGKLTDRSVASMLAEPLPALSGNVRGDLQVRFDRDQPEAATAKGSLDAENIRLSTLLPVPVVVERADLDVEGQSLLVRELTLAWADQKATLRGEIAQQPSGLKIRAEVESPGVDLDALLPEGATEEAGKPRELWPLPVTGTVNVRAGYVQRLGLRVEPLRASIALEPRRADLKVTEAALCGIAFPFSVNATPEGLEAVMRLSAKDQELERVAHCLTDKGVLISGRFDLSAELKAQGQLGEFAQALQGPVELRARNGEIFKFALIGNILSVTNVKGVLEQEVRVDRDGFDYRSIDVKGRFGGGRFNVEQAFLDSDALGLAATGYIGLDYQSRLSVLVAPFSRVDRLVRGIPIVGYVIGGAFTSIPVGVSGDIRDPLVVPLGPGAVTSELLGIFERTLKLPGKLVAPLGTEKPAAQP